MSGKNLILSGETPPDGGVWKKFFKKLLDCCNQLLEGLRLVHSQVGENLTVEADTLLGQLVDECRIGQTFGADGGVDTGDPKRAVFSFLELAANITVLKTFLQNVLGDGIYVFSFTVKSFCLFEDPFPACAGSDGVY